MQIQPLEAVRTRPYHYRSYNLAAMIVCSRLRPSILAYPTYHRHPLADQRAPRRARRLRRMEPNYHLWRQHPGRARLYDDRTSGKRRPDGALPEHRRRRGGVRRPRLGERHILRRVPRGRAVELPR